MEAHRPLAQVRPDQRWTITVLKFDELKHDESFCSIIALARAVNALHFVHTALIDNQADTPAGMRNRYNSLLFTCALFAEASLLVAGMQKHFRGHSGFQELAAVTNSKEARDLLKDSLFPVRNKLVFHFDTDEVRRQIEDLELPNPILMTAMGTMKLHTYYELADLVALRTLFGPVIPGKADQIRPVLQSVGDLSVKFLVAAENFMVDVLNERGWAVRDTLE